MTSSDDSEIVIPYTGHRKSLSDLYLHKRHLEKLSIEAAILHLRSEIVDRLIQYEYRIIATQ
jgi:hypothetical protein